MAGPVERSGFVGRDSELTVLRDALARAAQGRGCTVIVGGEAGIGKTRLLERFATIAGADGTHILNGACIEFGGRGVPYAPFFEAMRAHVRSIEPAMLPAVLGPGRRGLGLLLPEFADHPVERPTEPELGRGGQARLFEVVLGVIERISQSAPTVMIVEDVQWADRDTIDLLAFLLRHLRAARVLAILSIRSDDREPDRRVLSFLAELERDAWVTRIDLPVFDRRELGRLLAATTHDAISAGRLDEIYARSGGNPFYAEQLLATTRSAWAEPGQIVPSGLRDVLDARLDGLPPTALTVVRAVAAAGGRAADRALEAVVGLPPRSLTEALRAAIDDGVLVAVEDAIDGGGYTFRHALVQEAAYGQLLPGERARLHAAFAAHLETERQQGRHVPAAALAFHLDRAGDARRAVPVLIDAGTASEHAYAFGQAGRHFERALELWERSGLPDAGMATDRVWVMQRAAECALLTGVHARAIELGRRAIELLQRNDPVDPVRLGLLNDRLRWYLWDSGDRAAAEQAVAEALRLVPEDPPSVARARVLAQAAGLRMEIGDVGNAMRLARDAIAIARLVNGSSEEALAGGILGWCQAVSGDIDEGVATFRDALAIAERLGGPEGVALGHANLAALLDRVGRTEASLEVALAGVALVRRLGVTRVYGSILLGHAAKALFDLGRWPEAAAVADEGLELDPVGRAAIELHLARVRIDANQGRLETATGHLVHARALAQDAGLALVYGPALAAAEADLARRHGRLDEVRAAVDRGARFLADDRPIDPALGWLAATGLRAEADAAGTARARHDDAGLAKAIARVAAIDAFVRRASAAPATPADGRREAMLALCTAEGRRVSGPGDGADWEAVAARWDALARPHPAAYARFRLAEALLGSNGSRSAATAALRAAHRAALDLGAGPLIADTEQLARHGRIQLDAEPDRTGAATPLDGLGLTERETEVIRLVAAGWSNQQIADALFITRKTASVHVSNILGKFGVRNRVEAAAVAQRLGFGGQVPTPSGLDDRE